MGGDDQAIISRDHSVTLCQLLERVWGVDFISITILEGKKTERTDICGARCCVPTTVLGAFTAFVCLVPCEEK